MPSWPVRVFISLAGSAYHATPYCTLLKAGQTKAAERGHAMGKAELEGATCDYQRMCPLSLRSTGFTSR